MNKRDDLDWTAIRADFEGRKLSNRRIAKKHGVSESAIRKRAEAENWVRTAHQSAHSAHQAHVVILPPSAQARRRSGGPAKGHVELGSDLALRLLDELDAATTHAGELEEMIVEETAGDANTRRRSAMMKAVSLPVRALTLKTIAQALGALKGVEGEKGKKELAAERAQAAVTGRFAPRPPPKFVQ